MKNKKKNENRSTEEKVEQLVENVSTQKREEIKERLMFGEILSRSVGEGYKCLRKKDKKEFSNEYWEKDGLVDDVLQQLVIDLGGEGSSDSEFESEEEDFLDHDIVPIIYSEDEF
ncbi:unnamed protein product [Parnassius apollo]|uniref:(apollo) hypothetical protein n=1 Tax=Parnassius apollo TaxID=110799 RepID=A0A8S3X008_PARAO|nr:unnamed protein product [Parnassius apollo]